MATTVSMSVEENGQYVTREFSLNEIMERQRQKDGAAKALKQQKLPEPTPTLGLLSRTVLRSPIINWIIPARVRHEDFNDVVFIGEDFMHIKEIGPDGHLRHIASITDFGSRIRAARCYGEPRKPAFDGRLKTDETDDIHNQKEDFSEYIPPQVIVLTLESRKVMFLFARQDGAGRVTFVKVTETLPSGISFMEQPGKHLAVDPKSRAIAIAACQEMFIIYKTKSMAAWRTDFATTPVTDPPIELSPKVEERAFKIDNGVILKMEFLSPAPGDTDSIVLLIIFSVGGKTKMSCYDWDAHSTILGSQSSVVARIERYPLENDESHPIFVIPLQQSPGFLLVGEHNISVYRDILSGSPSRYTVEFPNEMPRYAGSSRKKPLWTNWARTARNWEAQGKAQENFYIVREDGIVLYVVFDSRTPALVTAGELQCTVDSAFASLDVGLSLMNPDVLIAAGEMSYGQVIKIGEWSFSSRRIPSRSKTMEFEYIESLPNWAPVMDTVVSRLPGVRSSYERPRDAVFTTSGTAPYGCISELRHGLSARIWAEAELSGDFGITGMWTLFDPTREGVFFLVSHPLQSRLYHLSIVPLGVSEITEDDCDLEMNEETLVACSLSSKWAIQVTEKALHLLCISAQDPCFRRGSRLDFPSNNTVLAAVVDPRFPLIVIAIRQGSDFSLQLGRFVEPSEENGSAKNGPSFTFGVQIPLSDELTCLQLIGIRGKPYAFVGTTKGELFLFGIDDQGLSPILQRQVEASFMQDIPVVCESVALLSSSEPEDYSLVCGMRNGWVYSLNLEFDFDHLPEPIVSIASTTVTPVGHTSARVVPSSSEADTAFVLCGSECCRLKRSRGAEMAKRPTIDNIWFTDHGTPGFQQSSISAIAQVPLWDTPPSISGELSLGGLILTISDSTFLLAQIDNEVKAVPRRLTLQHTPYRLLYSARMKMMVVAATRIKEKKGKKRLGKGFRSVRSVIQLIRLDDASVRAENYEEDPTMDDGTRVNSDAGLVAAECELWAHEKVYALLEWHWEERGKKYDFIVVGTGVTDDANKMSGRLIYFQTNFDNQGNVVFRHSKIRKVEDPVFALALYNERALIFTCGKIVRMEEFSANEKKWLPTSQYTLPSIGIQITVQAPTIYVSTAEHSLYALGLGLSSSGKPTLQSIFSDGRIRDTLNHLAVKLPPIKFDLDRRTTEAVSSSSPDRALRTLVLISDKGSSLAGLLQPSQATLKHAAPTVFEAELPRSVTRLRRGTIRPPWRHHHPKSFETSYPNPLQHNLSIEATEDTPTPSPVAGVLVDDIIGTAVDGTLLAFSILDTPAWRLLKFIENLISAHELRKRAKLSSQSGHDKRRHVSLKDLLEPGTDIGHPNPTVFYINGDALAARFIHTRVPATELMNLVLTDTDVEVGDTFTRLVKEFLALEPGEELGGQQVVERVVEWLREVLDAVL